MVKFHPFVQARRFVQRHILRRQRTQCQFVVSQRWHPWHEPAIELLNCLHAALTEDHHLRQSYFCVSAEDNIAYSTATPQKQAEHLDRFNHFLERPLPTVSFKFFKDIKFGDSAPGKLRINANLAKQMSSHNHDISISAQFLFLTTVAHELAHHYGFTLRPANVATPAALTVVWHRAGQKEGEGEDGFPFECHWLGGIPEVSMTKAGAWDTLSWVSLHCGENAYKEINIPLMEAFIQEVCTHSTTKLPLEDSRIMTEREALTHGELYRMGFHIGHESQAGPSHAVSEEAIPEAGRSSIV